MENHVVIASCQLPDIQQNIQQTLQIILDYATQAEIQRADLVCYPECYTNSEKTPNKVLNIRPPMKLSCRFDDFRLLL